MKRSSLEILRAGEVLDLGGIRFVMDTGDISPGDMYIAERNSGPKFLTALAIHENFNLVVPTTNDYTFNIDECVKVREA